MGNNPQEFDIIFRAALTEIESGRETLASVLAQHPEVAEELRPQLEAALWMHGRKRLVEPRPEFLAASRQRLVAQIQQAGLAGASAAPAIVRRPAAKTWQPNTRWVLSFALILMAVFSVFLIGEMLTYASQDSLPGEVLYPVKLASEKARLAFSLKASSDAELYIEFAQRRL